MQGLEKLYSKNGVILFGVTWCLLQLIVYFFKVHSKVHRCTTLTDMGLMGRTDNQKRMQGKFPLKSCTVGRYFTGMHDLTGKFTYDDFFPSTHAPLY